MKSSLDEVDYPTSDGEPMGETDLHRDLMIDLIEALKHHYRNDQQIYVSGNIMLYFQEGEPRECISPDVLVTIGAEKKPREVYKLWEVGTPTLVIEVTSRSTRMRDIGTKKGLYEAMGVQEYILFDPRADYLKPPFQVFRAEAGQFVACLAPEQTGYASRLGLTFRAHEGRLRIFETASGHIIPTPAEMGLRAESEAERAEAEHQRAETEHQRAETEQQRAEAERQRAEAAIRDATEAGQHALAEKARADRLAQRLRDLGVDHQG